MTKPEIESGLAAFFVQDHRDCEARWADVEELLDTGDIEEALPAWRKYEAGMQRHIAMEEEVLFPAYESATGVSADGPTAVMCAEHRQMRGLLKRIAEAIEAGDEQLALEIGDTLLMLVQQHDAREEGMLYPEAEALLAERWDDLLARLAQY